MTIRSAMILQYIKKKCWIHIFRIEGNAGRSCVNTPLLRQKWRLILAGSSPREITTTSPCPDTAVWFLAVKMVFLDELIIPWEERIIAAYTNKTTLKFSQCILRITLAGCWTRPLNSRSSTGLKDTEEFSCPCGNHTATQKYYHPPCVLFWVFGSVLALLSHYEKNPS